MKSTCIGIKLTQYGLIYRLLTLIMLLSFGLNLSLLAQNPIVTENQLTGNPASEWDIPGKDAGDLSIQGFATDISYNIGTRAIFKIDTDASAYTVDIYRLGYYQGNGARLVGTGTISATLPQNQPDCIFQASTGLTDCGNWAESAYWDIPANAISGIYIAKIKRTDISTTNFSHIVFIVRNDASTSDLLFQTSDATWQAYNGYGGNSLYTGTVAGFPSGHAPKVSYNRPFSTRSGGAGGGAQEDWVFNSEYPMLRWLERNGYDVTYTTNVDTERRGNLILNHKVFLSVGHDEYWSKGMRDQVTAARNAGVHLAFFSGNEVYWKTRHESSIDGTNTNFRTLVCYKEGPGGENTTGVKSDPNPEWTGLWRYGCAPGYDPLTNNACRPENELTGQISWDGTTSTIQVPSDYKSLRFWRNSPVAGLANGQSLALTQNSLGYEWDWEQEEFLAAYPAGRVILSRTFHNNRTHHLSLYRHSSGALVFGAGTVQWAWGLDNNHDRGNEPVSPAMQQATVNLLADMGVQPATLQNGLNAASASNDNIAPVSVITSPLNNANLPNSAFTITGTASDNAGVVAGVEVSVNGGAWQKATGTDSWSFNWTPSSTGTFTIQSRSFDDLGNIETPGTGITVNVSGNPVFNCPCSIWDASATPATTSEPDPSAVELGVKFRSTVDGFITGIRFYKGPQNVGTFTVNLWNVNGGNALATATFTNITTQTDWQQVNFGTPVAIVANTTYIASYHTPSGFYSVDENFFTSNGVNTPPLNALINGLDGPNGVYKYGASSVFPNETFNASNYWVDVVFDTEAPEDNTAPLITSVSPIENAGNISIGTSITATFNEAMDAATINSNTFELRNGSGSLVSASVSYNPTNLSATLTPNAVLNYSTNYTVQIKGESTGAAVKDLAGNALAVNFNWTFTTQSEPAPPPPPPTEAPGGPILVLHSSANPFSIFAVEILRAEGLNEFATQDISQINASLLNNYDVILLGEVSLNGTQVTLLTDWVNAGGTLIAFRPDADLAALLGITPTGGTLSEGYLLVNTNNGPGVGIVNQTIQFHGTADYYTLNGATAIATLYSNANTATQFPAVTLNEVGNNGGRAIAFTYDLARSIVYTRQGNPAWAGQERDGQSGPIRANDLFFGGAQTDWINLNKVAIPQADEQQRFLVNIILQSNLDRKPLPRFWFLPNRFKAAIVMTGDDHGVGLTDEFFNDFIALSAGQNSAQDVLEWRAIRGSSYIYPNTPVPNVLNYQSQGFEIGIHVNTGCANWTPTSLRSDYDTQMASLLANFPGLNTPVTHRTHCIAWSDWATQAIVQRERGIRLDVNYYYWPESWIQDRPGMFTGSGMPMRFANLDGTLIDCYQVTTQMTDESGQTYPKHYQELIDRAIGQEGYYGVFCANFHTDRPSSRDLASGLINYAKPRNVPVVSSKQMLEWLDARNNSSFENLTWNGNVLNFSIDISNGAVNLYAMLPVQAVGGQLTQLTANGTNVSFTTETIKGIQYAFFPASESNFEATYSIDNQDPQISNINAAPAQGGTSTITWNTNEPATSQVVYGTNAANLNLSVNDANLKTNHSLNLTGLADATTYFYRIISVDAAGNTVTNPNPPANPFSFTTPTPPAPPCFQDAVVADFNGGTVDANTVVSGIEGGEVSLKPTLLEEFTGNTLPNAWQSANFNSGGATIFAGGQVSVNGSHVFSNNTFAPGTTLEFKATYAAGDFQNVGFSADQPFNNNPWIVIGRGNIGTGDNGLYARNSDGQNILLGTNLLNQQHTYSIKWNTNGSFEFYVDGILVNTPAFTQTVSSPMYLQISNFNVDANPLTVDWMRVSPYSSPGTFISRVFDAGTPKVWGAASWTVQSPSGTSIQFSQRQGNTATPDGTWTAFAPINSNGADIEGVSRYIQYQAVLNTSDVNLTPILESFAIACENTSNTAPAISLQPTSQAACAGTEVSFNSEATGNPSPTVQWQQSTDQGNNWTNISGATNPTFSFLAANSDNGKLYRAVWSNSEGSVNSNVATLTVNGLINASISTLNSTLCLGDPLALRLDDANGQAPFTLVVNGITYTDVNIGETFASIAANPSEASIWSDQTIPSGNPDLVENSPVELGLKFRAFTDGFITGIRFYKGPGNTGTHIGRLWAASGGNPLAEATFINETASGWQEVRFSNPVFIKANTTYIASYFSPIGGYAFAGGFFNNNSVTNGLLTALSSGTDGANGVFRSGGGFPNQSFNDANYWVDVVFEEIQSNPITSTFTLTSVSDAAGCTQTGVSLSSVEFTVSPSPLGSLSVNNATSVCEGDNLSLTFNATVGTAPFELTVNGEVYSNITPGVPFEVANNANTAPFSIWPNNPTPAGPNVTDNTPIELGLKFRSSEEGLVKGIRFYKGNSDNFSYQGSLWLNSTEAQLATAGITTTAQGWVEILFNTPVQIQANTTYIVSYFSPSGFFAINGGFFVNNSVSNGPLTALASGTEGPNGVFNYNVAGFPKTAGNNANYWVDVIFSPSDVTANYLLSSISDANSCTTIGNIQELSTTVSDQENPVANCKNITVELQEDGTALITPENINNGSTDNCGIAGLSLSVSSFNCSNLGENIVTLTITDISGNTASCQAVVTVVDNTDPVPNPDDLIQVTGECSASVTAPTATDNCAGTITGTTTDPIEYTEEGTYIITWTFDDGNGNTTTATQNVIVDDLTPPQIICPSNLSSTVPFSETGKVITYPEPTFSDNCPGANIQRTAGLASGATFPLGTTTITYLVTDAAGKTATCSFTVSITENADNTPPLISNCPANISVNNDLAECAADVSWTAPTANDNSGSVTLTSNFAPGTSFPVGTSTVTYTATDAAGNQATCSFTVTVIDNESPTINCPANISETVAFGETGKVITYPEPTFSDNCPGANIQRTAGLASGATFPLGTTTITYLVTDAAGKTTTCSFTVTINSEAPPSNAVIQFILINADADTPIGTLSEGTVINLFGSSGLSIQAITNPAIVGSVRLLLTRAGVTQKNQVESVAPYALNGDDGGNYVPFTFTVGTYTLTATPYSAAGGGGSTGTPLTINFSVVNQPTNQLPVAVITASSQVTDSDNNGSEVVSLSGANSSDPDGGSIVSYEWSEGLTSLGSGVNINPSLSVGTHLITLTVTDDEGSESSANFGIIVNPAPPTGPALTQFVLINADTDTPIRIIQEGETINLFGSPGLSIQALTSPTTVGSVRFVLSRAGTTLKTQTESAAPYALNGDAGGNYTPFTFTVGAYTLVGTPFSAAGGGGTAGNALTANFFVVNQAGNLAPIAVIAEPDPLTITDTDNNGSQIVTLNSTGSNDPDGSIVAYEWTENDTVLSIGSSLSTTLSLGTHVIILKVTDNQGAIDTETITVQVVVPLPSGSITGITFVSAGVSGDPVVGVLSANGNIVVPQGSQLSILGNINDAAGSMRMTLVGGEENINYSRTENVAPYALFGDFNGVDIATYLNGPAPAPLSQLPASIGSYNGVLPSGDYTITLQSYSGLYATGSLLDTRVIQFNLSYQAARGQTASAQEGEEERLTEMAKVLGLYPVPMLDRQVTLVLSAELKGEFEFIITDLTGRTLYQGSKTQAKPTKELILELQQIINKGTFLLQVKHEQLIPAILKLVKE
ncbi:MAG: DUF4082 domain-containing protein [Microscillaceae bacterium]|nr:DUF4082 domain-containing protein [Microscillaceae bacterium]